MARRPPATLADYLVVALTPTLIGLLVGSLMWFLVEVFHQGEGKFRMLWVMAFFVLGVVSLARLSMEQGWGKASLFVLPLAGALSFVTPPSAWPLMALVWWAAHKLTWDATLIDDSQDASGQGLLEQMGLDPGGAGTDAMRWSLPSKTRHSASPAEVHSAPEPEATTAAELPPAAPWWETLLEPDRRPHAPGVWVVYFSLAALPLFGIGGWFVTDPVTRAKVFGLLVIYVASGMGLLLATSFLGLRRYLRQRQLEMPLEMTSTWIVVGVVMICAMLLLAAILPRPSREHSLSQLPFVITSAARKASRIAFLKEGTKDDAAKDPATTDAQKGQETSRQGGQRGKSEGAQQPANKTGHNGKSAGKTADGKGPGEAGKSQSSGSGSDSKGGQQSGDSKAGDQSSGQDSKANAQQRPNDATPRSNTEKQESAEQRTPVPPPDASQPQPPPAQPNSPTRVLSQVASGLSQLLGGALRWLFYAALLAGALIAAWFYRDELISAWQKLLEELRALWESWFGGKTTAQPDTAAEVLAPPRRFASYPDPFLTGAAARMSWPQLVRYTFEALEAWGREHDCPRSHGQTAHEFALALGSVEPEITSQLNLLAAWYSQLAYAPRSSASGSPERLRDLWANLAARRSTPVVH